MQPSNSHAENLPLPLFVAKRWQFPLQYHLAEGGTYLFAVLDWIAGLTSTGTVNASYVWTGMGRNEMLDKIKIPVYSLKYTASDRKVYHRDFTIDQGLYFIAQHLRSTKKRPVLNDVKAFLFVELQKG